MLRPFVGLTMTAALASLLTACGTAAPEPQLRSSIVPAVVVPADSPAAPSPVGPGSSGRALGLTVPDLGDEGDQTSEPSPTAPASGPAWRPIDALPPAHSPQQVSGRPVDIVLSPHPDDETLSLGVWIANRVGRGDRVIVVALTDGRATGATGPIGRRLGRVVDRDEIAAARMREMRAAAAALGVAPGDVYAAHLDTDASPGGSRATVPEVGDVIAAFAERFPQAEFATMSYLAEHHKDHLNAGQALVEAWRAGLVTHAEFAVSRLYWNQSLPGEHDELPGSAQARAAVVAAARAYDLWDPAHGRLSVGWYSVRPQFEALLTDPVDRLHDPQTAAVTLGPPGPGDPTPGGSAPTTAGAGPPPSG